MSDAHVPVLAVRHAQKHFGAVHALKDVSLEAFAARCWRCSVTTAQASPRW